TWGHVRLFSPWEYNIDKVAKGLLVNNGWSEPKLNELPTGNELVEKYFKPLSNTPEIKDVLHLNTRVLSISQKNIDKMKTANRNSLPFVLYTEQNGTFKLFEARAIIDASGTWGNPNPANSSGGWLKDEVAIHEHIF
ncbi:flavoprotein, partial [Paraburkholderia sp. BR14264]